MTPDPKPAAPPDNTGYLPQIAGVAFDPADVDRREKLFKRLQDEGATDESDDEQGT